MQIIIAKYGITLSFGINYTSNSYIFPTLFAATAIGLCNSIGRSFSSISPLISHVDEPIPMILFAVTSVVMLIAIFFLQVPKNSPDELLDLGSDSIMAVEAVIDAEGRS